MYRFICSKRYVNLLFTIGKSKNLHTLSKDIDMTISHLSNVTDQWEREGLIKKKRVGREVDIEVTKFGKQVMEVLQKFDDLVTGKINKEGKEDEGKDQVVPPS